MKKWVVEVTEHGKKPIIINHEYKRHLAHIAYENACRAGHVEKVIHGQVIDWDKLGGDKIHYDIYGV